MFQIKFDVNRKFLFRRDIYGETSAVAKLEGNNRSGNSLRQMDCSLAGSSLA